nr:hypothetical protein [Dermacoccus nishinomiyaensis]
MTAADRCDRCGAQAFIKAVMSEGLELRFCGHHGREHLDKLREVAVEVIDETPRLSEV